MTGRKAKQMYQNINGVVIGRFLGLPVQLRFYRLLKIIAAAWFPASRTLSDVPCISMSVRMLIKHQRQPFQPLLVLSLFRGGSYHSQRLRRPSGFGHLLFITAFHQRVFCRQNVYILISSRFCHRRLVIQFIYWNDLLVALLRILLNARHLTVSVH